MMEYKHLIWKENTRKEVFSSRVFSIDEVDSSAPNGKKNLYTVMRAPDWAIIIPILQNKENYFLMVRQWRHGEQGLSLEFPGGVLDENEDEESAARRELLEETGWSAGSIRKLGEFNPNPAIMKNRVHIFEARELKKTDTQSLDPDEYIDVEEVRVSEVLAGMGRAPYVHALMASALCLYLRGKGA